MPHIFRTDCVKVAMVGRLYTVSHAGIRRESGCLQMYQRLISRRVAFDEDPLELEYQMAQPHEKYVKLNKSHCEIESN